MLGVNLQDQGWSRPVSRELLSARRCRTCIESPRVAEHDAVQVPGLLDADITLLDIAHPALASALPGGSIPRPGCRGGDDRVAGVELHFAPARERLDLPVGPAQ